MMRTILSAAALLTLAACATQAPRTPAEVQQDRAEARADDARDVADTHRAANKEVQQAQDSLRKAEYRRRKQERVPPRRPVRRASVFAPRKRNPDIG